MINNVFKTAKKFSYQHVEDVLSLKTEKSGNARKKKKKNPAA